MTLTDGATEQIEQLTGSKKAPLIKAIDSATATSLSALSYVFPDGRPCEVVLAAVTPENNRALVPDSVFVARTNEIWIILNTRHTADDYDTDQALIDVLYVLAHEFGHGLDPMRFMNAKSELDSEVRAAGELRANVFAMQVTHAYLADIDDKWKNDDASMEAFLKRTPVAHFIEQDFKPAHMPYVWDMLLLWLPGARRKLRAFRVERAKGKRR